MRHIPFRECGYAVGFIVVTTALYIAAYYAMVVRGVNIPMGGSFSVTIEELDTVYPSYPIESMRPFFQPIHEIDRKIRSRFWSEEGEFDEIRQKLFEKHPA
jgi:hypothetical protein